LKTSNGKFFTIVGILLIIAGLIIFPDDGIIGVIGILLGAYNVIKGIRLSRGIQPLLIRKQQERDQSVEDEVREKIDNAEKDNSKNNDE